MQNCEPVILTISHADDSLREDKAGDKICILGFSRGAYTACWYCLPVLDISLLCFTKIWYQPCRYDSQSWPPANLQPSTSSFRIQDVHPYQWFGVEAVQCIQELILHQRSSRFPRRLVRYLISYSGLPSMTEFTKGTRLTLSVSSLADYHLQCQTLMWEYSDMRSL